MEDNSLDSEVKEINGANGEAQGQLPNAVATLVLGIISIVGCLFYGLPGLICGIIAIALHTKDKRMYQGDKIHYANSYKLANAGYICAVIGTSLSALYFIIVLALFIGLFAGARF